MHLADHSIVQPDVIYLSAARPEVQLDIDAFAAGVARRLGPGS